MGTKPLLLSLSFSVIVLITGIGLFAADQQANAALSVAEMNVTKLTCGACVENISKALADMPGIESVKVSVTTGRAQVLFNPQLIDAEQISQVVTTSGYPARLIRQLSNEQYLALQNEEAELAEIYVAKVGDRLVGRDEFELRLKQKIAAAGYQDRPEIRPQVAYQTWQELKQRLLLLDAAEKNQIVVQDAEVDLKMTQLQQLPNFASYIAGFGTTDDFFLQTKEDLIIDKNIQQHVLAGVVSPTERQARLNQWFKDLLSSASVTIYDAALKEEAGAKQGGCGGGCCG